MLADLHCHSYYSDGELPPARLAAMAKEAGAEAFALTDHDTARGVEEAAAAADNLGIRFVSGVEISTHGDCDVHILGYNLRFNQPEFIRFTREMEACKRRRVERMLEKLEGFKMPLTMDEVRVFAKESMSRAHVARAMVKKGYEPDVQSCFNKWLREGAPCYAANSYMKPCEAVQLIKECGGAAVLAHPVRLKLTQVDVAALVKQLADCGLDGIEADYKFSGEAAVRLYAMLAERNNLFVTNGGDFHTVERNVFIPRPISQRTAIALGLETFGQT